MIEEIKGLPAQEEIINPYSYVPIEKMEQYIGMPEPKWEWCVGGDWRSMTFKVTQKPHWLARILQKYLLDIYWRKAG